MAEEGRLQDVDAVDLLDARLADGEAHTARGDHRRVGRLAILAHQLLRIVDQAQELALGDGAVDHRHGRDHGPASGPRPTSSMPAMHSVPADPACCS
jgi:hypothetical protein